MTKTHTELPLWNNQPMPYAKANAPVLTEEPVGEGGCIRNVTQPTLTIYPAKGENTGIAVVVIPGGGYSMVCMNHEGYAMAEVLSSYGITAAILKYRLPLLESSEVPQLVPITDARQALKVTRSMADDYGFDVNKVGVLGFSAGSHLSTCASLWKSDDPAENPNFSGQIYGVTNLDGMMPQWLEKALYHRKMTEDELAHNRLLDLVSPQTPPTFMAHAVNDGLCHITESTLYAEKCFEHGVPVEMHLFPTGDHGFGVGRAEDGTDQWMPLFVNWVKRMM